MSNATRTSQHDDGDYPAWTVTDPVNLAQLDAEIAEEMGWQHSGLTAEGGATAEGVVVRDEDPEEEQYSEGFVLRVYHDEPDNRKIGNVIRSHAPDPDWSGPGNEVDLDVVARRIAEGEHLDEGELGRVVEALLRERSKA